MNLDEAFEVLGEEKCNAAIYAMNTLLIAKGIYSTEEFVQLFIEYATNFQRGFQGKSTGLSNRETNAVAEAGNPEAERPRPQQPLPPSEGAA